MSETITERPVLKAIAAIMAEVGSVEKRGTNSFHNYQYATAADIAHALQKKMAAAGLIIIPYQKSFTLIANESVLVMEFAFAVEHVSGDRLEERPVFSGMSSAKNTKGGFDDKAANKCLTAATKYFTLNLFRIPTGDYFDSDKDDDKPAPKNGNGKRGLSASLDEPDDRTPDQPFNDIDGVAGRPKWKGTTVDGVANPAPAEYHFITSAIRAQRSVEDLQDWGNNPVNKEAIAKLPDTWIPHVKNEYRDRLHALQGAA